jgi:hypothetical protein
LKGGPFLIVWQLSPEILNLFHVVTPQRLQFSPFYREKLVEKPDIIWAAVWGLLCCKHFRPQGLFITDKKELGFISPELFRAIRDYFIS